MPMQRLPGSRNTERRIIKMNGKTQKQKGFHMPHVFIILLIIMLFVVILSI